MSNTNNQTTQAVAAAGAGQPSSPTDTKNHEADILKFLQEKSILEPIPNTSRCFYYKPVDSCRRSGTLVLDSVIVDASVKRIAAQFVREGFEGVDKLPEKCLYLRGELISLAEAFDFCCFTF